MDRKKALDIIAENNNLVRVTLMRLIKWDENLTVEQNSIQLAINPACIRRFIDKYGLKFKRANKFKNRVFVKKDYSEIINGWDGNKSIFDNAQILKITSSKAYLLCTRLKLPYLKITKCGQKRIDKDQLESERNKQIKAMRAAGFTLELIGDNFGVSKERIRQIAIE